MTSQGAKPSEARKNVARGAGARLPFASRDPAGVTPIEGGWRGTIRIAKGDPTPIDEDRRRRRQESLPLFRLGLARHIVERHDTRDDGAVGVAKGRRRHADDAA